MLNFQQFVQTAVTPDLEVDEGEKFTPVFMSSLLQAPLIEKVFAVKPFSQMNLRGQDKQKITAPASLQDGPPVKPGELKRAPICAIITANGTAPTWKGDDGRNLGKILEKAGVSKEGIEAGIFKVFGMELAGEGEGSLCAAIKYGKPLSAAMGDDLIKVCQKAVDDNPTIRCFLFECTELPPYADSVRKNFSRPVFDLITLANFFHDANATNATTGHSSVIGIKRPAPEERSEVSGKKRQRTD